MKLQIDTTYKTIKVEESVKLSKLVETLKRLFPNNEWKDFTLETNTTIEHWSSPIIIKEYIETEKRVNPYTYPWYQPMNGTSGISLCNNKIFNVEC